VLHSRCRYSKACTIFLERNPHGWLCQDRGQQAVASPKRKHEQLSSTQQIDISLNASPNNKKLLHKPGEIVWYFSNKKKHNIPQGISKHYQPAKVPRTLTCCLLLNLMVPVRHRMDCCHGVESSVLFFDSLFQKTKTKNLKKQHFMKKNKKKVLSHIFIQANEQ